MGLTVSQTQELGMKLKRFAVYNRTTHTPPRFLSRMNFSLSFRLSGDRGGRCTKLNLQKREMRATFSWARGTPERALPRGDAASSLPRYRARDVFDSACISHRVIFIFLLSLVWHVGVRSWEHSGEHFTVHFAIRTEERNESS